MDKKYISVFGPIKSRRLGRSLGINLFKEKVCSFDCLYCEVDKTLTKTIERKEWIDTEKVKNEIKDYIENNGTSNLDYITFSGYGEPTLHIAMGEIIDYIKSLTDTKVAVLTNSSLIYDKNVQKELMKADLVVPSLDAPNQDIFEKIDLPYETIDIKKIISGLIDFRKIYSGQIWLEIMVLDGINDTEEIFKEFVTIIQQIKPDKVQLNILDRSPAYSIAKKVSIEKLKKLQDIIGKVAELV